MSLRPSTIIFSITQPSSTDSESHQNVSPVKKKLMSIKATKRILAPYVKARRRPREVKEENKTFSFYAQKKPAILMKEKDQEPLSFNLLAVMKETADSLCQATKSTVANVYMVDESIDEIYMIPDSIEKETGDRKERRVSYKIETGTIIAAHVAHTKQIVKINDLLEDIRFPLGLGNEEVTVKAVICVPVVTPEGDCMAVFELYRSIDEDVYDDNDLYLVVMMSTWVGSTIYQHQMHLTLQKQRQLTEYLLQLAACYFNDASLLDNLISEVVSFAKLVLDAEHGLFYVFRINGEELVADEYESRTTGEHLIKRKNIRISRLEEDDILKVISASDGIIHFKHCENDIRVKRQQENTSYRIRSILASPIKMAGQVLGLMQIINKKEVPYFLKTDKSLMKTFAEHCALVLKFAQRAEGNKKQNYMNQVYEKMLQSHMKPCIHDSIFLLNHMNGPVPHSLNYYDYYLPETLDPYACQYVMYMFNSTAVDMFENSEKCAMFVLSVKKAHRDLPYHNFKRAFHVCHCMFNLLTRFPVFTPIEVKAMMLASYCHGVDYNGKTCSLLELTNDPLYYLYQCGALLEQHYFFIVSLIIKSVECFTHMSPKDYNDLMDELKEMLLATDASTLFIRKNKLIQLHSTNQFDISNKVHKLYLKTVMMGVATFANFCKPYNKTAQIVKDLYKEHYKEGDIIKKLGLIPLSHFDRNKENLKPRDQWNFMMAVVLSNTNILSKFIPSVELLSKEALYEQNEMSGLNRSNICVVFLPPATLVREKYN